MRVRDVGTQEQGPEPPHREVRGGLLLKQQGVFSPLPNLGTVQEHQKFEAHNCLNNPPGTQARSEGL